MSVPFTCATCGDLVSGRAEHCTLCHRTFTGTTAGDAHQTGIHGIRTGADRRRCRTDDELAKVRLIRKDNGRWGYESTERKWWEAS